MSQRIVIPKGTIDPNQTSVVEVPPHLQSSHVVVASPRPHHQPGQPGASSIGHPVHESTPAPRRAPRPHTASPQESPHDETSYYTCYCDTSGETVSDPSSLISQRSPPATYQPLNRPKHWFDMSPQHHEKTFPPAKTKGERRRDRDRWEGHRQDEGVAQLQRHMGIEEPSPLPEYGPAPFQPHSVERMPYTGRTFPYPGPYAQRSQTGLVNWNKFKVVRKIKKATDKMKRIRKVEAAEQKQLREDLKNYQSARKKFVRDAHDVCALM